MTSLVLLRPEWLALLPAVALFALRLWRWRRAAGGWERVLSPAMFAAMRRLGHLDDGGARGGLAAALASGLIVTGLAGPAIPRPDARRSPAVAPS